MNYTSKKLKKPVNLKPQTLCNSRTRENQQYKSALTANQAVSASTARSGESISRRLRQYAHCLSLLNSSPSATLSSPRCSRPVCEPVTFHSSSLVLEQHLGLLRLIQEGGRVVTSEVALIRRATFSSFRTTKFFTMLFFARVWGVFRACLKKFYFVKKRICVFIINGPNRGVLCKNGHLRIHTRTPRNTTLHHPSTHSDNDTDPRHIKSLHFRTHLDQYRKCLYLLSRINGCAQLNLCWSTKDWVVAARGRRWTWRLWRATCRRASRRVPSTFTQFPSCNRSFCARRINATGSPLFQKLGRRDNATLLYFSWPFWFLLTAWLLPCLQPRFLLRATRRFNFERHLVMSHIPSFPLALRSCILLPLLCI